jgi:UDP-N-acetylmuramate--alanine ligase
LILLNLQLDHNTIDVTAGMFKTIINHTQGMVLMNADDQNLNLISPKNPFTFSIDAPSQYRPTDISLKPFSTDFSLNGTHFSLSLPGRHNLYNALACIAILSEMGIPLNTVAGILHEFQGIERRFDVHLNNGKYLVIDDYAHNPHKISSLMQAMKHIRKGICYVFQPHGYGPTQLMKNEYIEAFSRNLENSDHLILLPIFYSGGTARKGISSQDLADGLKGRGKSVEVVESREEILNILHEWYTYVVFGARDETLSDFARKIADILHHRK